MHPGIKTVLYDVGFERRFRKYKALLPKQDRERLKERFSLFQKNPFHPQLATHKLKGALRDYWAFSLNHSDRIVFRFVTPTEVFFVDIGSHEVYR